MATMTTMTTTLGLLKLWPPTTSAAAMLRCAAELQRATHALLPDPEGELL